MTHTILKEFLEKCAIFKPIVEFYSKCTPRRVFFCMNKFLNSVLILITNNPHKIVVIINIIIFHLQIFFRNF